MKVESKPIQELLETILSLDEAMVQGAREWCTDQVTRESIEYTVEQRKRVIDVFRLEYLTAPEPKVKRTAYLDEFDRRNLDPSRGGLTREENIIIFQTQLYALVTRLLRERDITEVECDKLPMWIENEIVCDSSFPKTYQELYYNLYPNIGFKVLEDIAEGIREQRQKMPQQKLFN